MIAGVQGQRCLVYEYKSARFIPEVESNQENMPQEKNPLYPFILSSWYDTVLVLFYT